jgi:muramoyltetrapeptide carboxypeptidase
MIVPPYLKKGDAIGITCASSYLASENVDACIQTLQDWGFEVMVGKTVGGHSKNYFSAVDADKITELQAMLDSADIKAILFGRGGYGMGRIIDKLSFKKFKKNPKWLIGFSDITVLHCHLQNKFNIASIHGPMAIGFNKEKSSEQSIKALQQVITGKKINHQCASHEFNSLGKATGTLVGGNLALLCNVIGTPSDFKTKDKILFIEDVGEYKYSIDRMFYQLKRSGKLHQLAGLIIGGFTDIKDTERPFGKSVEQIIKDIIQEYDYPVCFQFPISHGKDNLSVKVGCSYALNVTQSKTTLKEL